MSLRLGFVIYIYIGRFFCNFIFKLTGSGLVFAKTQTRPRPVSVFFFKKKTQT